MATNRRALVLEGPEQPSKGALNVLFAEIARRIDKLEGKSGEGERVDPLTLSTSLKGANLRIAHFSVNQHGDDLEQVSLAKGAYMDTAGQWVASLTQATIVEFNGSSNVKIYTNTGLVVGAPFTPTIDTTIT